MMNFSITDNNKSISNYKAIENEEEISKKKSKMQMRKLPRDLITTVLCSVYMYLFFNIVLITYM